MSTTVYSGWCIVVTPHTVSSSCEEMESFTSLASAYKTAAAGELFFATSLHLLIGPPPGHTPDASPQPAALEEVTNLTLLPLSMLTTVSSPCVSLSTSRRPVTNRCKSTGSASTPAEGNHIHTYCIQLLLGTAVIVKVMGISSNKVGMVYQQAAKYHSHGPDFMGCG